ncbi:MAG: Uma2 family endonuclease [Chloroflexi bacterium]|nr:Uma2 family endonuclease [Chloroflexota bacterium]
MTETIPNEISETYILPPELWPDISHIVTEDDAPVGNLASEKQMRLLTEPLYTAWKGTQERPFLAAANVGVFASVHQPPLVPDVFLSLDVIAPDDWWAKGHRAYFIWEFGKTPDLVIEIVSNREGGEDDRKLQAYARMGIPYYVIYDPQQEVQPDILRAYALTPRREYEEIAPDLFVGLDLGLTLWQGSYENKEETWLRWQDADGALIPTGAELSARERQRAQQERQRTEIAEQRAEAAEQRAERLSARLRQLGLDPNEGDDVG